MDLKQLTNFAPGTIGGLIKDQGISLFRQAVFGLGVLLVGTGAVTDEWWLKYSGAAMAIVIPLWVAYSNYKNSQTVKSAIQVGQDLPKVESEKTITAKLNAGQIVVPTKPEEKVK